MNRKDQPTLRIPLSLVNEKPRKDNEDPSWRPSETERKPERRESQDQATHGPEDRRGEDRTTM